MFVTETRLASLIESQESLIKGVRSEWSGETSGGPPEGAITREPRLDMNRSGQIMLTSIVSPRRSDRTLATA
ncbi:hypothetical protein AB0J63_08680 [Streptosporangium canum]|uniref:hypothetical protein n=1 Tax=Streptosporangium canum TaxID=324952 RepID=UPI00343896BB